MPNLHTYNTYRKAIDMLTKRGLSFREVSKITGVSTPTLQTWMKEAREISKAVDKYRKQV